MPQVPQVNATVLDAGVVAHRQPVSAVEGSDAAARQDKFGAFSPWHATPTRHQFAEEGGYLMATNATPGTGLLQVLQQRTFINTAPNIYIGNPDAKLSLYLDYLKMISTAANTASISIHYAIHLDVVARAFSVDNTATIVAVNPNAALPSLVSPIIKVQSSNTASAVGAPALTNRLVGRGTLGGLTIAGTEMLLTFGSTDAGACVGAADAANQPGRRGGSCPPVIIPPGGSCTMYFWCPSSTAGFDPEFELGMWCR